jgi:transcriptional regulator with XRE-family HTH domain
MDRADQLAMRAARNIRKFRQAKGISQEALASQLGFALPSSISALERGKTTLSLVMTLRICDCLGVTIDDLLAFDGDQDIGPHA